VEGSRVAAGIQENSRLTLHFDPLVPTSPVTARWGHPSFCWSVAKTTKNAARGRRVLPALQKIKLVTAVWVTTATMSGASATTA
jgi:hypothetical protein